MNIKTHVINNQKIAEVVSPENPLASAEAAAGLLGNLYYQGYDKVIVYEKNIDPAFFDLQTMIAGEVLQKFSNFRMKLAIVGDFSKYRGNSLRDFIFESNQGKQILFSATLAEALKS